MESILLNLSTIKTPQLIGIALGCAVFIATIAVVMYLLYASGMLREFVDDISRPKSCSAGRKAVEKVDRDILLLLSSQPRLHDYLVKAMVDLPLKPVIPELVGHGFLLKEYCDDDNEELLSISDGSAKFGDSAYSPSRIWSWLGGSMTTNEDEMIKELEERERAGEIARARESEGAEHELEISWPSSSEESFRRYYAATSAGTFTHLVIRDALLKKHVGMLSLTDNCPRDLSVRIDRLWLTPGYQGRKVAHTALLLLLQHLFASGYRRVTVEVNAKNVIMRRCVERCGFLMESILRKHRIHNCRSSDTALYVILNSEFAVTEVKLKKYLNIDIRAGVVKVAQINSVK